MSPDGRAAVLRAPNQLCYFVCFFTLFVTYFVHNVDATASYDQKELLDIRTAITHLELDEGFFFNESETEIKVVSRYYLPELEYLMISCKQYYLPRVHLYFS